MNAPTPDDDVRTVASALERLASLALAAATSLTAGGERIDEHQVIVEKVASAATDARVARSLVTALAAHPGADAAFVAPARVAIADLARSARERLDPIAAELGLPDPVYDAAERAALARLGREDAVRAIGQAVAASRGKNPWPLDATLAEVRASVRQFADKEVAPHAEHIHRTDELVPDRFITAMAELGYFGLSVPEAFGGHELGNLAMILTTEELSRASLASAGSLITRPEILAKALLAGGTDAQKRAWLPRIAAGEIMVAISVTEPNVGSDVAAVACRATPTTVDGVAGYAITGAKAWCTFAGRADVIALLARTDPDPAKGAKGLSLFIVEKPRFDGHEFTATQPGGGRLAGKADRTPGYRGMHSFTLALDDWFVPAANLVGEQGGLGRGFYLQMAGFAAGRSQSCSSA